MDCCGGTLYPLGGDKQCCGGKLYDPTAKECCGDKNDGETCNTKGDSWCSAVDKRCYSVCSHDSRGNITPKGRLEFIRKCECQSDADCELLSLDNEGTDLTLCSAKCTLGLVGSRHCFSAPLDKSHETACCMGCGAPDAKSNKGHMVAKPNYIPQFQTNCDLNIFGEFVCPGFWCDGKGKLVPSGLMEEEDCLGPRTSEEDKLCVKWHHERTLPSGKKCGPCDVQEGNCCYSPKGEMGAALACSERGYCETSSEKCCNGAYEACKDPNIPGFVCCLKGTCCIDCDNANDPNWQI